MCKDTIICVKYKRKINIFSQLHSSPVLYLCICIRIIRSLEFIPEVQVEVRLLGAVAVAEGSTEGTEHRVVVVGSLDTKQGPVAQGSDTLLRLKLCCHELVVHVLHVADTGEGHLLLDVMTEPVTTNGIAEDIRNDGAEEQTSVEHRLEREIFAKGE